MASDPGLESFADIISAINDGADNIDLTARFEAFMRTVSSEAQQQGKAQGSFTVTFKVTAINTGRVDISVDDKSTAPKPRREPAVFFTNDKGKLARAPFKQENLPFGDKTTNTKLRGVS